MLIRILGLAKGRRLELKKWRIGPREQWTSRHQAIAMLLSV
jgi:hypothetical protein